MAVLRALPRDFVDLASQVDASVHHFLRQSTVHTNHLPGQLQHCHRIFVSEGVQDTVYDMVPPYRLRRPDASPALSAIMAQAGM